MNKEINGFTFYRDFYNLIDTMSISDKKEIAVAILDYIFKGITPNLKGHNQAVFNTLKHQLDKSKNRSKNAQRNQSNENQNEIKIETNDIQNKNNLKSNENQIEIKQGNKTSILNFKFYISNFIFNNSNNFKNLNIEEKKIIGNKLLDWCKYKREKNKSYKETGLNILLKQVEKNVGKYGLEKVLDLIDECMANNYQGIIWEKLENKKDKAIADVPSWLNKEIKTEEVELNEKQRRDFEAIKNGTYRPESF